MCIMTSATEYNTISENRRNMKSQVFEINELITFEFWSKCEWEFTLNSTNSADRAKYSPCLLQMVGFMQRSKLNPKNLYPLIVVCKRIADEYFRAVA